MLKAFIFDIGGVLLRTEDLEPRRKWERLLGLPEWGLAEAVFNSEASRQAQQGQATWDAVWAAVHRQFALTTDQRAQLQADFWRGDVWDADLLGFIAALRPRFKTGVISNALTGARASILPEVGATTFDDLVFSCEEGLMKPAPEIYRRALARLNVHPAEAVFVDDVLKNIQGAEALGMRGLHFTDPARARAQLQTLITQP